MRHTFTQHVFPNGLRLLHVPDPSAHSVYVALIGAVGRRAETGKEVGAAHFLEHLFFDGTARHPSSHELNKFLEEHGGQRNGLTSQETVEYFAKVLPEKVEVACVFLADIFFNSLLRDEDVEKERQVIAQEAAARRDNPSDLLYRVRLSTLYVNQTIGQTIFDEERNLPNITKAALMEYMRRNYIADHFILSISGNVSEEEALRLADKYFGQFARGEKQTFLPARIESNGALAVLRRTMVQSKLSLSFRGYPFSGHVPAQLLAIVFGGGASSRLLQKLRHEMKIAYRASAQHQTFSDTGYFTIETFIDEGNAQRAVDEISNEIKRFLRDGLLEPELEKAKSIFLSSFLFRMEDSEAVAHFIAWQWLFGFPIETVEQRIDSIKTASTTHLKAVAQEIFSDPPKVNLITSTLERLDIPSLSL